MRLIVPAPLTPMHLRRSIGPMAVQMARYLRRINDELRYEPVRKRITASYGGDPVCDTTDAMLVWEPRRVVPMYAVPERDVTARLLPRDPEPVPDDLPRVLGPEQFGLHDLDGEAFSLQVEEQV